MQIRKYILAGLTLAAPFAAMGETVSQKEASKIAQTFFNALYGEMTAPPKLEWNGRQLTTDRLFSPFYIYNHPKGGFVMISAENKAFPVLAYSRTDNFRRDHIGEEETEQIRRFAREIELIRYDSRVPESAMWAWQNMPEYITQVVNNPYATPEYRRLDAEERERIEQIDRRNSWIVMPTAVEFDIYNPANYRDVTLDDITAPEEEEIPFRFYEDFLATVKREAAERDLQFEEMLRPTKPVVRRLGAGHFEIRLPERAVMMRVYNLSGAINTEKYYKETETVNLNIESLPSGFYAGLILGESGKVYGFKLSR